MRGNFLIYCILLQYAARPRSRGACTRWLPLSYLQLWRVLPHPRTTLKFFVVRDAVLQMRRMPSDVRKPAHVQCRRRSDALEASPSKL